MSTVCGARLLTVDFTRPRADLPPLSSGPAIDRLGQKGNDEYGEDEDEGEGEGDDLPPLFVPGAGTSQYSDRARPGTFEYSSSAELEPLGVLVLEFTDRGGSATFASTTVCPRSRAARRRLPATDWTEHQIASRARRHYIIGDASEIIELAKSLAESSDRLASLLRSDLEIEDPGQARSPRPAKTGSKKTAKEATPDVSVSQRIAVERRNTLSGGRPLLLPEKTPPSLSLQSLAALAMMPLPGSQLSAAAGSSAAPILGFKKMEEVHDFLRRAGIAAAEAVNPCLKAGLMAHVFRFITT
jgi:hypothetical protein